jgi:hypothetical protein
MPRSKVKILTSMPASPRSSANGSLASRPRSKSKQPRVRWESFADLQHWKRPLRHGPTGPQTAAKSCPATNPLWPKGPRSLSLMPQPRSHAVMAEPGERIFFRLNAQFALGADGQQWILYRKPLNRLPRGFVQPSYAVPIPVAECARHVSA